MEYKRGDRVNHPRFGSGEVRVDEDATVVIRFEHGIEECPKSELTRLKSLQEAILAPEWHDPLEVVARTQALAIRSINDMWGVFSLARIALLPHQLWVCRKVVQELPTRWLIADDVGLGKTIEAGLIISALLSKDAVRRILVLCPASLVEQWQERLRNMFDIRMARYTTEADTSKSDFWNTHSQVIASLPTLRKDSGNRHQRMFNAEPWDLVVVDEAHHLNADEQTGQTLGYSLMNRLVYDHQKVKSAVFFTGTPHRGKHYQFFALLKLLRADLFDPAEAVESVDDLQNQMRRLHLVMIRNNKQLVTDMKGKKLFYPPDVFSETYSYSLEEEAFYVKLTEFILTGKAYASGLSQVNQRAVMLILICMQKLASSSVAAIRSALKKRLNKINNYREELENAKSRKYILEKLKEFDDDEKADSDELSLLEEKIFDLSLKVYLMEDEKPRLQELIEAAELVKFETKIGKIIEILETRFSNRQVLFFTEYKATQSLLMSALIARFGNDCVTFINGDGRADDVIENSGRIRTYFEKRERAAEKFNSGEVRFLISTEAGGEGIDLQETCYSLIHVDLPWNPMRLHQRVGRLNRYGQTQKVEVINLRNPDTVETRIWDKLNSKIENIMQSLDQVMEESEDLLQLVLGMTSPKMFREVFSEADQNKENLSRWFDSKTATFGGQDAVATVKELMGSCEKFDFQKVSSLLPQVDLPDLRPFFETILQLNKRRISRNEDGLSFITPESWLTEPAIRKRYEHLHFDRACRGKKKINNLLGVGHCLMNQALKQALELDGCVAQLTELKDPVIIFQIVDRVTGVQTNVRQVVVGVKIIGSESEIDILKDWELLMLLNANVGQVDRSPDRSRPEIEIDKVISLLEEAKKRLDSNLNKLDLPFQYPKILTSVLLYPKQSFQ
ncbi:type III restriction endonuclease subunit R [Halomicronema hongdechloris C2206]|uniref:Type III restriction endonuclease subunit R n=1 Tax=Halomicronema hongdechloris C2206 TaxID=1641165 RepID=A0A1Z3HJU3_9CYAN|nr:SNF2-related protein [Halomicronema hongdechloris]ASC70357.1 type III restriction endonuclease subunit R [Halomicronema hongdechloris C2206]